ncbi:hypothetical protein CRG98_009487 [Punica granatum]|uniref:Uncharacterized protein n=1 Tax=Punica granatum TaxID=22663 RepID=A0A2I0KNQ2_PUNGR|nr:hypothetical protein CRG98_009487 [Punica granatum]
MEGRINMGLRWSTIARSLPGRTDNEIKNYWRTHFKNKAKIPAATSEKAKARILKRQHFQQQQLQHQQQQPHQLQLNQVDLKRIMSMLDDTDHNRVPYVPQEVQVAPASYNIFNNITDTPSASEASNEDFLWDGLWNLDDFHGGNNFGVSCTNSKACVQNLISPFC